MDTVQTQIKQSIQLLKMSVHVPLKYYFTEAHLSQPINKITKRIFIKKDLRTLREVCILWENEESEKVTEEN